ncbi:MAG: methyltransferase domain-containing protein [Clostridiales bacterium]|nr:methyltransferase domain-containing protein [Clostridiales bacterium]
MKTTQKPQYGNWVAPRLIRASAILALLFIAAEVAVDLFAHELAALRIILAVPALFFAVCFIYFCYARRLFSPEGGDIQSKVLDTLVAHIGWDGVGAALDIGCGSGALVMKLAEKFPQAQLTGLDYWGADWSYAKAQCERNAEIMGVKDRTGFVQGTASELPFEDGAFDLVVSNMTFHEVKDTKHKPDLIREALRVLKPGGKFAFQDLFLLKTYYGTPDELTAAVKAMGAKEVHFEITSTEPYVTHALKLPFMLGTAGVLWGER